MVGPRVDGSLPVENSTIKGGAPVGNFNILYPPSPFAECTQSSPPLAHPRTLGWVGTAALAIGGSNQSVFLIGALLIGQGDIAGQGTAAIPLLIIGLVLSWLALPGWTELVLMWPNRVGGIAATCGEAFRPYAPVLGSLAGISYWWGWVPTCGLTALLSASAISQWFLPHVPAPLIAGALVALFAGANLLGVVWTARLAVAFATISASLAFLSALIPIVSGSVDWRVASSFHLNSPFPGHFGIITSAMAGLYLVGFAAPAFEAAACHVGETINPAKNVPRAMYASAAMATLYFAVLPVVWLGAIGHTGLAGDLAATLGPAFAPLFGALGKSAAIWFMVFNMFHGTLAPLTGVARTLSQLSEDGLLPETFALRTRNDCPWVAILITAGCAIVFLLIGDPIWLIAAANFTYLLGIGLPSVAVWLLRRDQPKMERPYRAPRGTITLGLMVAIVWMISTVLGFQQFGLPTVILGLVLAYSGAGLYAWRKFRDRRKSGLPGLTNSLHVKLTGAMLIVLILDGAGYYMAVRSVAGLAVAHGALVAALADIFVAVAILTISVGLVLPGMIAHSVTQITDAAKHLASGTVADFSYAMDALANGDLDAASARIDIVPVIATSRDEVGQMADSFNKLQKGIAQAALGLERAREGIRSARNELTQAKTKAEAATSAKSDFLSTMSHEIRTPMNGVLGMTHLLLETKLSAEQLDYAQTAQSSAETLLSIIDDILDFSKMEAGRMTIEPIGFDLGLALEEVAELLAQRAQRKGLDLIVGYPPDVPRRVVGDPGRIRQILMNLLGNAIKFTQRGYVFVSVECDPAPTIPSFRFTVEDTGIGIADEKLATLFERFTQADTSTTRMYGGTGLGLAISRQLVELMGGEITASSRLGEGSTFSFALSLPLDGDVPEKRHPISALKDMRVLVVDDNPVNLRVVSQHLASHDVNCVCVSSAVAGLSALRAAQQNDVPFHIAILDHRMPGIDGEMLGREIKADPLLASVSLLMLTSIVQKADLARFQSAGFSAYLVKPARPALLLEALAVLWSAIADGRPSTEMVTRHTLAETRAVKPASGPQSSALPLTRVLLAEDNLVNQKVAKRMLERAGCRVDVASNGLEAVEMWTKRHYALVFMDCQMPVMDGFTATQEIRSLERNLESVERTPIIAVTANTMSGDRQKCLDIGMDDFIPKPIALTSLDRVLQRWAQPTSNDSEGSLPRDQSPSYAK